MFCALSGFGGLDVICRVYKNGSSWYLTNIDENNGGETNVCYATCFD